MTDPIDAYEQLLAALGELSGLLVQLPALPLVMPCGWEKLQEVFGPGPADDGSFPDYNPVQDLAAPLGHLLAQFKAQLPEASEEALGFPKGRMTAKQDARLQSLWSMTMPNRVAPTVASMVECLSAWATVPGIEVDPPQRRQIDAFLEWLSAPDAFVPNRFLSTPIQLSPGEGQAFGDFPRTTTLTWSPVRGATSYHVQVQYCEQPDCTGTRGTIVDTRTSDTSFTFEFVGEQPGRWRVAAVPASGDESAFSLWRTFVYTV